MVERIICREGPDQSYALYLPSHYDPGRKWPVILALDPGARGPLPVEAFREAAEEFGYILIGSNNSRNGPVAVGGAALHAMWEDAIQRFSLDLTRIYLAGFSGGARMAGRFALMSKQVRGVIICGAGFDLPEPEEEIPFSVILTSGTWDSNLLEIKTLNADLLQRKARVRLLSFEGGHTWPSSAECREAVQWLELWAYRDGITPPNETVIDSLFQKELKRGEALESTRRYFDAYLTYTDLKADMQGLRDLKAVEQRVAELAGSNRLRSSIEEVQRLERVERRYIKDFLKEFFREKPKKIGWWQDRLDAITKMDARKGEDPQYQLLVRRLREFVWRNGWERSWVASESEEYERAAYLAEIALLVRSEESRLFYHLSRMYAQSGQHNKALENLEKAVENGFADFKAIRNEPAFSSLHEEARFQKLVGGENLDSPGSDQ